MKNYVAIVKDHSYSMFHLANGAKKDFNSNVDTIRTSAEKENIDTIVSVIKCGVGVDAKVEREAVNSSITALKPAERYVADGHGTPLWDSVGEAVDVLECVPDKDEQDVTFLVIVITDGEENYSQKWKAHTLANKIRKLQGTDRWSFAFRVPKGYKENLVSSLGVYDGNVQEWEQTEAGLRRTSEATSVGISSYYSGLSRGVKSTRKFYTDLSRVDDKSVKNLRNLSGDFMRWQVQTEIEGQQIRPFCEKRLRYRKPYTQGYAYYQLVKTETVQGNKKFLIRDRDTKAVYGGADARRLLGVPDGRCKLAPSASSKYDIFVQSSSVNRKLPVGTYVLYYKNSR